MISDPVMEVAGKIDTDENSDDAMERGMKLLAERLGEMDWIDREMEEACRDEVPISAVAPKDLTEESKDGNPPKEENRIKYLEIYNDEIINNKGNQDSIQLFYTPKMDELNE